MNITKKHFGLLAVIFLSYWAVQPLFIDGFFPIHDDTQVARVYEMGKVLRSGVFPVRWVPDLGYGYGYPIFNFYAPLAYYFGGILTLFGIDALIATKIMISFGSVIAGVFMYLFAREFWGRSAGVIAGIFYVYAPYHAVNMYVRGAVGELWAYGFIPLVFYGFWKVHAEKKWKWVIVGSIGYAGVILSHNLTAFMLTPFLGIFILFLCIASYRKDRNLHTIYHILSTIFFGLILSAFYWLPALLEMNFTNVQSQIGGGADFRDHFVCLPQLWESSWGFGGSIPGCIDGLSFKIGKLHVLFSILSFILGIFFLRKDKKRFKVVVICGVFLFVSIFLSLDFSRPLWELMQRMEYIQYPWRFLVMMSFFSSLLAGGVVYIFTKKILIKTILYQAIIVCFVTFAAVFYYGRYFIPQTQLQKTVLDYTSEYALKWTASKISDEYLPANVKLPASWSDVPKENNKKNSTVITVENHRDLFINNKGQLPVLRFGQTNIEIISNAISAIGVVLLIIGIIYARKK